VASLATAFVTIRPDTRGFGTQLQRDVSSSADRVGREGGTRAGKGFTSGFKGAAGSLARSMGPLIGIGAVAGVVGSIAKQGIAFQDTMNSLQAVSGATAKQMAAVSKRATALGNDLTLPGVSAADAGNAMLELSKGGLSVADSMKAAQGTLRLAGAASIDAAKAAEIQANALNSFGLKAKDAITVSDQLANTANASSVEITDVAYSMQQAGAVFSSFQGPAVGAKKAMTELNTAVGLLGNAGIKGSDAGTSIKSMMMALIQPAAKAGRQIELLQYQQKNAVITQQQYDDVINGDAKASKDALTAIEKRNKNIKVSGDIAYTAAGKMKSLPEILQNLKTLTAGSSQSDVQHFYKNIFGTDGIRAALVLTKQAGKGYNDMEKAVTRAGGAQKVAEAKSRGLGGALRGLQSQFETIELVIYQKVAPGLEAIVRGASDLISKLQGGGGHASATFTAIGKSLSEVGALVRKELLPEIRQIMPVVLPVAKFLLAMFGEALIGAIKGAIQTIRGVVQVVSGVFKLVSDLIHGRWGKLWGDFKEILVGALNLIVGAFRVWFNVGILSIFKHGVFRLLSSWRGLFSKGTAESLPGLAIRGLEAVKGLFEGALRAVGRLIVGGIRGYIRLWTDLFKFYRNILVDGWKVLRSAFGGALAAVKTMISTAITGFVRLWRDLFTKLKGLASTGMQAIRTGIDTVLGKIKTGFSDAVGGIKRVWSTLRDAVRKPIAFIVNTVYNKGIVPFVNGIPFIPGTLHTIKGWATGGYTGAGGKYEPAGIVHRNEHVIRSEATESLNRRAPGFLDHLNKRGAQGSRGVPAGLLAGRLCRWRRWPGLHGRQGCLADRGSSDSADGADRAHQLPGHAGRLRRLACRRLGHQPQLPRRRRPRSCFYRLREVGTAGRFRRVGPQHRRPAQGRFGLAHPRRVPARPGRCAFAAGVRLVAEPRRRTRWPGPGAALLLVAEPVEAPRRHPPHQSWWRGRQWWRVLRRPVCQGREGCAEPGQVARHAAAHGPVGRRARRNDERCRREPEERRRRQDQGRHACGAPGRRRGEPVRQRAAVFQCGVSGAAGAGTAGVADPRGSSPDEPGVRRAARRGQPHRLKRSSGPPVDRSDAGHSWHL
jgi:TP901 family phage tail tape measure protein